MNRDTVIRKAFGLVCLMAGAFLLGSAAAKFTRADASAPAASSSVSDNWGLSFQEEGKAPVGNASPKELAKYNATFVEETEEKVIYLTFDCGFENGGIVVWDDEDWSTQLVSSVFNSLANAGMIDEDTRVEQHFLGDFMGDFTIDTATALKEEQEKLEHSWVLDPGVVFDQTTLHNNSVAAGGSNTGLVIGGPAQSGENGIDYSIGFKDVANAEYVRVEGGKDFVLVGNSRPDDFDWTTDYGDDNKLLIDAADGGYVEVADGSLTLGSNGLDNATAGWINSADVAENGSLVTKNGEFAVWDIDNEGTINVTEGSILHTNTIDNAYGTTHVAGGLTTDRFTNDHGTLDVAENGIADIGELTSSSIDSVVSNAGTLNIVMGDLTLA